MNTPSYSTRRLHHLWFRTAPLWLWLATVLSVATGPVSGQSLPDTPPELILTAPDDVPMLMPEPVAPPAPAPVTPPASASADSTPTLLTPVQQRPTAPAPAPARPPSARPATAATTASRPTRPTGTEYVADRASANLLLGALANKAGLQYIPNPDLEDVTISARIRVDDPMNTIADIGTSYGWFTYNNGSTLYVRTASQMSSLPTRAVAYPLRYLRQKDIEALITPMLTPGSGQVKLESKTNTVLIRDNEFALRNIEAFLKKIDRPKNSINVQTTIFRIVDSNNPRYGIDWSQTLGDAGYPISFGVQQTLDMLFNFASPPGTFFNAPSAAILRPGAISFVTRALTETLNVETVSNPNLILEDNEEGTVSLVDRFPIIEFQPATNQGSGANFISLSSTIRYRIDETDPIPTDENPGRQLGTSLKVRATILDDGLIRLMVTPRSADITELIRVPTGENTPANQVPRVAETSTTTTVSISPGSTLLIGGFTQQESREEERKVPVLGDIPLLGTVFKDRETRLIKTRVVFAVTPTLFNPANANQVQQVNARTTNVSPDQQSLSYGGDLPRPLPKQRGLPLPKR